MTNPSETPNSSTNGQATLDGSPDWLERAITELVAWRGGRSCRDGTLDRVVAGALMRAHNDAIDAAAELCRKMSERLMAVAADCEEPEMATYAAEAQALAEAQARIILMTSTPKEWRDEQGRVKFFHNLEDIDNPILCGSCGKTFSECFESDTRPENHKRCCDACDHGMPQL